jgi:hypothetical protein
MLRSLAYFVPHLSLSGTTKSTPLFWPVSREYLLSGTRFCTLSMRFLQRFIWSSGPRASCCEVST